MAPTIKTTKPVATAIATFVSTDRFIVPFNDGGELAAYFPFLNPSIFRVAADAAAQGEEAGKHRKN
jgi:hypothetical protein